MTTATALPPPPTTARPPGPPPPPTVATLAGPPTRRARWRRRLGAVAVVALVAAVLAVDASPLGALVGLFVLVVPFERLFPRHRQRIRRPAVTTDVAYLLAQPAMSAIGLAVGVVVGIASLAWIPGLAQRPLVTALPAWLQLGLGVVLFDLVLYWVHRWGHEVPFLWRFHAVHHSTRHLDWVSGLRVHPFDGALLAPPFVFLLAAGFGAELTGALAVLQVVVGLFLHANVRWRWRPVQRLVATPEFHHWHHADEADAHRSNYAGLLPVWDQLFGTWWMPADRRPRRYGVTPPLPDDLWGQLAHPFRGLRSPWWYLRHPAAGARHAAGAVRRGLDQIRASTLRDTRRAASTTRRMA